MLCKKASNVFLGSQNGSPRRTLLKMQANFRIQFAHCSQLLSVFGSNKLEEGNVDAVVTKTRAEFQVLPTAARHLSPTRGGNL